MPYTPHWDTGTAPNATDATPQLQTSTMQKTTVIDHSDTAVNGAKIMRGSALIVLASVGALWVIEKKVRGS